MTDIKLYHHIFSIALPSKSAQAFKRKKSDFFPSF